MTYFCKQKCFWKARVWTPGESVESSAGEPKPPADHFSAEPPKVEAVAVDARTMDEPMTMSELAGVTTKAQRPVKK